MAAGWWAATFATITARLRNLTTSVVGTQTQTGTITVTMKKLTTFLLGLGSWGTVSVLMKKMVTNMPGTQTQFGTMAMTNKKLQTAITAKQTQSGPVATAMKKMTTAITAIVGKVSYDSTGAGKNTFSTTMNWTETVANGSAYVIADVLCSQAPSCTAEVDTTAMTQLESFTVSGNCTAYRFGLAGVSAGAHTITITPSTNTEMAGNSVAYDGVVTVNTTTTASGTGTSASQSATCISGEVIVQSFFAYNSGAGGVTISSPTGGTNRFTQPGSGRTTVECSDATASATFGATISGSFPWVGFSTVLQQF